MVECVKQFNVGKKENTIKVMVFHAYIKGKEVIK